uniref:Uncharacterized protein n=1 Tax=Candidatus Nitrotoga fabula TaxID=2182327 RepID=A0A2X0R3Y7_9PROT|nr:protein of unknown function [Candidatus Nitrotoga fabula]
MRAGAIALRVHSTLDPIAGASTAPHIGYADGSVAPGFVNGGAWARSSRPTGEHR